MTAYLQGDPTLFQRVSSEGLAINTKGCSKVILNPARVAQGFPFAVASLEGFWLRIGQPSILSSADKRVWVKIKPPGIGPQVLVIVSIYQGAILGTYF